MAARIVDHTPRIKAAIQRELARRLRACCILVVNHAKMLINTEGAGVTRKQRGYTYKINAQGRRQRVNYLVYGQHASKPGEPPHKQKGRLLASVAWELNEAALVGRVGSNLNYSRWLELGTRKMAARPWLRRALKEKEGEIRAIMGAPIRLGG